MHTAPMPDSAGEFDEWKPAPGIFNEKFHKPGCTGADVRVRCWESSCGGYEDYQYRCFGCGAVKWEEGADA